LKGELAGKKKDPFSKYGVHPPMGTASKKKGGEGNKLCSRVPTGSPWVETEREWAEEEKSNGGTSKKRGVAIRISPKSYCMHKGRCRVTGKSLLGGH